MEYQHRFKECCNPLKLEKHRPKKDLRQASAQLQESWGLSRSHYLCSNCRKQLLSLKAPSSSSTIATDDADYEVARIISPLSELSIDIQLPIVNQALLLLNISVIDEYSVHKPSYVKDKYEEICCKFATLFGLEYTDNLYENSLHFKNMIENLKEKFDDENTNRDQKMQILTLLPVSWSINKICDVMGATKHMAVVSKRLKENQGVMSVPGKKKGNVLTNFYKMEFVLLKILNIL